MLKEGWGRFVTGKSLAQPRNRERKMPTNFFVHKLFEHPQGSGASRQNSRDITDPLFETQGRQTFEGGRELFGHHPFAWKTPGGRSPDPKSESLCSCFLPEEKPNHGKTSKKSPKMSKNYLEIVQSPWRDKLFLPALNCRSSSVNLFYFGEGNLSGNLAGILRDFFGPTK